MLLIFAILLIIILVVLVRCIVIVPQSNAYVTEWLGVYKDTWGAGLHIRTPFLLSLLRTGWGILFGLLIGTAVVIVAELIYRLVRRICGVTNG